MQMANALNGMNTCRPKTFKALKYFLNKNESQLMPTNVPLLIAQGENGYDRFNSTSPNKIQYSNSRSLSQFSSNFLYLVTNSVVSLFQMLHLNLNFEELKN